MYRMLLTMRVRVCFSSDCPVELSAHARIRTTYKIPNYTYRPIDSFLVFLSFSLIFAVDSRFGPYGHNRHLTPPRQHSYILEHLLSFNAKCLSLAGEFTGLIEIEI